jgi:hypothetical protein
MKNFMLIALLSIVFLGGVNAQNIHFGVKGGLNLANINGDYTEDLKTRTSFHVGGLAEILVLDQLYFQPELLYSAQGAKGDNMDATIKMDYIQVPIMAKYFLIDNLSMELGPQLSFLVNSDFEFDGDPSVSIDSKDIYKKMDFGLNFGLSYKLNKIFFSGRYNLGLTQILEGDLGDEVIQHNRGFQFSVGYLF